MAKLADAHGSGPCELTFMQVQVLLSAPKPKKSEPRGSDFLLYFKGFCVILDFFKRKVYNNKKRFLGGDILVDIPSSDEDDTNNFNIAYCGILVLFLRE